MSYGLVPFSAEWEPAVQRFNQRLGNLNPPALFLLPSHAQPDRVWGPVRSQHWIVTGDDGEVHGGCLLQTLPAWIGGGETVAANLQSPLSEGIADKAHAGLALWMVKEILRQYPYSYSVGMGSLDAPYARLVKALRWRVEPVPFWFRVLRGRELLANLAPLRKKLGAAATAGSWIPVLPNLALDLVHRMRCSVNGEAPAAPAGASWTQVRQRYAFAAERSAEVLDAQFPEGPRFRRVQVPGGLAVLCRSEMNGHKYFGDMCVATLAEAVCEPAAAPALLDAAVRSAREFGAAMLLTNHSDPVIQDAARGLGWFNYPSNYLAALSPKLAAVIGDDGRYCITRGDGDGLLNL